MITKLNEASLNPPSYCQWAATKEAPESDRRRRLYHAILGLRTEIGEYLGWQKRAIYYHEPLNEAEVKKELGDLAFYSAILLNMSGAAPIPDSILPFPFDKSATGDILSDLISITEEFDAFSRELNGLFILLGRRTSVSDIRESGLFAFGLVSGLAIYHGWTLREILWLNYQKLEARFPNGFSSKHAALRLDEASSLPPPDLAA